ncbi:dATP/dGTP pyrophosphohydrolase domain-containing protein [Klebsiella aerogenes]|uniref:dATP/dGTP pyrophosphohydrolase domain-containing protein n=1 Tax=Klebsiella aerogenes TaxID=548 RepID=UPI00378A5D3A
MTNNQLTENSVNQLLNSVRLARDNAERDDNRVDHSFYYALTIALEELQERRKAAMDSEPVAWAWHYREQWHVTNDKCRAEFVAKDGDVAVLPLYRHAQPAPEREQVRQEHAEWSQETFGNVGPVGPLKHLSKEALEAAEQPGDLSEWADMQFLLWDAQRRAGITDEQITLAMFDKLAVNKRRSWPEPKDGEPRLHIKEQPAPVVPDGYVMVPKEPTDEMLAAAKDWTGLTSTAEVVYIKMLAAAPQSPGSEPATVPGKWIPVSERMPEDEQEVLTINRMGHCFVSFFDKHSGLFFDRLDAPAACCIEHVLVTHWMTLPAAPQEVK